MADTAGETDRSVETDTAVPCPYGVAVSLK